jgi:hypothetical protein
MVRQRNEEEEEENERRESAEVLDAKWRTIL